MELKLAFSVTMLIGKERQIEYKFYVVQIKCELGIKSLFIYYDF